MKNKRYMHYICIAITLGFVALSVFVFQNAFVRIKESVLDFIHSVKYYFEDLFSYSDSNIITVNDLSSVDFIPPFNLPKTWEEFTFLWHRFWGLFASRENINLFLNMLSNMLYEFSKFMMLAGLPIIMLMIILFKVYMSTKNNKYNIDSVPLKIFKFVELKIIAPIKNFILEFVSFVKDHKWYSRIWLVIWAYNFNFISIVIEFFAFYFYFTIAFDLQGILVQIYKLLCDLTVCMNFIPWPLWIVIGVLILSAIAKKIGYSRLRHMENKNCGFINERPIVTMVCGTMGKKKTTAITDMALSQEKMFRDKAFEKLYDNDLKFPNFPWINLENTIKLSMTKHLIYNLATCKKYFKHLEICFYKSFENVEIAKSLKRHLKKRYFVNYDNFLFDYDYVKYGFEFDNGLYVENIWEVIQKYSQLYFVYFIHSSLIISNYSVRTDNLMLDNGNFPMWDTDFFFRESATQQDISRHAHIIDFDSLRLGRKVFEENAKKNSFDFGVVGITEIGKERKNTLELRETKKNDDEANQKNDGFNSMLKMCRHSSTIDNYPFVKFISDEQRPESLGSDARDLCEIVHIKESSDNKLALPFFSIFELVNSFLESKFTNNYYTYRFNRSDNTLFMYLFKKIVAKFHNFYNKIYNTFGYCKLSLGVEQGTQDGAMLDRQYFLMFKKIYSKRFSTDCFSDFFAEKTIKSPVGIEDLEEYATEKATFEELKKQNSYFINDLLNKGEKNEK